MSKLSWRRPSEWLAQRSLPELGDLRDEMERVFDRLERGWDRSGFLRPGAAWSPEADLTETSDAYVLRSEIPNVTADDLDVRIDDGALVVSGEKKSEEEKDEENFLLRERFQGSFTRRFRLPGPVKEDQVEASYRNGVLTVRVPKSGDAGPRARRIPVTTKDIDERGKSERGKP